ncbi:MAG: aldehyde:ferredoxin oxidoreductase [Candidatus Latescibacteria bacterium]|nr:aldehyde:ferredoxin oxidoreductase [Candidatus Latescibacterota bacterium]NIO57377.1 aldehyde:ferredoxin oxidoreductase [Candidatus Latescibacterota bacterium]
MKSLSGYHGVVLDVDLSSGKINRKEIDPKDFRNFIGGRGLGIKLLWDALRKPGVDPLSPENPLLLMPGAFSGFPLPSASRTCVVTKSPITTPKKSKHKHASTITYSNMGGFFGPEIRFAGYDGIMVRGSADRPVYLFIDDDRVEIRKAQKFWGMGTDEFDRAFIDELGDRRIRSCYIGPAGENLVPYACIINTTARAAGRGGTGCVMGSKNLKAVAVRGSRQPDVAMHKRFLELLEESRKGFEGTPSTENWRRYGTGSALIWASDIGAQAVKNYREGTYIHADKIGGVAARRKIWQRDFACFVCPLACKKSGRAPLGPYAGIVHDGPEYETGTMLGANLLIDDMEGMMKAIWHGDDFGLDIISVGNVIGFLMEAYDKGLIDLDVLDGIDLKWGNVDAVIQMLHKIAHREGIGEKASKGVHYLAEEIGRESHKFAAHCKGHSLAAWNCHYRPTQALCYVTANRGACHLNGHSAEDQNSTALVDSTGVCLFAHRGYRENALADIMEAITTREWSSEEYSKAGERIYNLEKSFNFREGFRREDDVIADRFFEEPLTIGRRKGAVLDRGQFEEMMNAYYAERGWDSKTTQPSKDRLKALGLDFV